MLMVVDPPPLHKEAWHGMLPVWVTLERITAERVKLYFQVQPPGDRIPLSVNPFQVEDSVPMEDKIVGSPETE